MQEHKLITQSFCSGSKCPHRGTRWCCRAPDLSLLRAGGSRTARGLRLLTSGAVGSPGDAEQWRSLLQLGSFSLLRFPKAGRGNELLLAGARQSPSWISAGLTLSLLPPCRCTGNQPYLCDMAWPAQPLPRLCSLCASCGSRERPRACSKVNKSNSFCWACRNATSRKKKFTLPFQCSLLTEPFVSLETKREGRNSSITQSPWFTAVALYVLTQTILEKVKKVCLFLIEDWLHHYHG